MPPNLKDYQTLCESFKASEIDVLQGRQVRDLMSDLRRGKDDWDLDEGRKIAGCKTVARDTTFQLIYAFLQEHNGDGNAAYNATVFVVSHFRIFGYRIRKMVRGAFENKFVPSVKQRRELEKWPANGGWDEDDATTEDNYFDCWDFDDS
ncbi:geranylgeranyl pyrophosphate synthetase [Metarhizium guizhouense ARSEF 977]|uniref:Geranylgeranyl pyrophosphate synthetase n=1 Tax=Metarhizium guizhouense (strain ARSEF 977) TaxID=1276136 RepID=A0A0B4GGX0_METGA|nr:geranylgeranyl pyrophosphate synthetase [Metarhizium guizhouense ARSEF 977]